ncbi:helix-hairpin-helix domain-containing protein, partial [Embleya sp. NPDC059259]|uniref:helix-hairpin-helix domain-containing protein n=1 Tax=Embleya sp. NPDC059259 TaxID=3346796 RepID=UPI003688A6A0
MNGDESNGAAENESAPAVGEDGSTWASDKPDPVALLRDQLARLARGEAPTVVGGVAHIDAPHSDGAERARRRTAVAADTAEAAALAAEAARVEAGEEPSLTDPSALREEGGSSAPRSVHDVELPPSPDNETTAPGTSVDASSASPATGAADSAAASRPDPESTVSVASEAASPMPVGGADGVFGSQATSEGGVAAPADRDSPDPTVAAAPIADHESVLPRGSDAESGAADDPSGAGVLSTRDVGRDARDGERRQVRAEVGPGGDGGVGGPSSPRPGGRAGGGGWVGPGMGGLPAVPAAAPVDRDRRPFAAVAADVARVLAAAGAPERMAPQVAAALGDEAAELLAADPWAVLAVPAIAPGQADLLARGALGAGWVADDPRRVRAIVLWLLRRAARQGDTAIEADAARAALAHFEVGDPDTALRAILAEGRVMAFAAAPRGSGGSGASIDDVGESGEIDGDLEEDFEEPDELGVVGGVLLALDDYALAEEAIAEAVVRLLSTVEPWPEIGDGKLGRALSDNGVLLYAAGPGEEPPAAVLTVAAQARE